jgi:NADPH:quinone reductase-like Zn-dependent oxidoreductase
LDAIRPGGEVVVYGALAGRRSAFAADELIFGAKRLRGFWLQRWLAAASPDDRTAHYDLALAFLGSGLLDPIVAKTFSLDEVEAACRFATEMGHLGKVVLAP